MEHFGHLEELKLKPLESKWFPGNWSGFQFDLAEGFFLEYPLSKYEKPWLITEFMYANMKQPNSPMGELIEELFQDEKKKASQKN